MPYSQFCSLGWVVLHSECDGAILSAVSSFIIIPLDRTTSLPITRRDQKHPPMKHANIDVPELRVYFHEAVNRSG